MTAVMPLARVEMVEPCPRGCATHVIKTVSFNDGTRKYLDPTPKLGGQYTLDSAGRAHRRKASEQFREIRTREHLTHDPTYNVHTCLRGTRQ